MSLENLNNATDALNAAATAYNGKAAAIDAKVDEKLNDMRGVAQDEIYFSATLDPDAIAPDNLRGGTFNDLQTMIDASSRGAVLQILIPAGKTVTIATTTQMNERDATFVKTGAGANPVIDFTAYLHGGFNRVANIRPHHAGFLDFTNIDFHLPEAKIDGAADWLLSGTFGLGSSASDFVAIRVHNAAITGGLANELSLMAPAHAGILNASLRACAADGPLNVVGLCDVGISQISTHQMTLANGAVLNDAGLLGTDLLVQ